MGRVRHGVGIKQNSHDPKAGEGSGNGWLGGGEGGLCWCKACDCSKVGGVATLLRTAQTAAPGVAAEAELDAGSGVGARVFDDFGNDCENQIVQTASIRHSGTGVCNRRIIRQAMVDNTVNNPPCWVVTDRWGRGGHKLLETTHKGSRFVEACGNLGLVGGVQSEGGGKLPISHSPECWEAMWLEGCKVRKLARMVGGGVWG